jgi:hypothetical protein
MDDANGDDVLMSMLMRFGLFDWWSGKLESDETPFEAYDVKHQLGDEFLSLLLAILMERNNTGVGESIHSCDRSQVTKIDSYVVKKNNIFCRVG